MHGDTVDSVLYACSILLLTGCFLIVYILIISSHDPATVNKINWSVTVFVRCSCIIWTTDYASFNFIYCSVTEFLFIIHMRIFEKLLVR